MKHQEDQLQKQLWQAFQALGVTKRCIAFHPANEGRSPREGAKLKAMGVVAGVADFIFLLEDEPHWAAMELKAGKNGLSVNQRAFRDRCEALGRPFVVVRSLAEALVHLDEWGLVKVTSGRVKPIGGESVA